MAPLRLYPDSSTPCSSWRWYSALSNCPCDSAISPSSRIFHFSNPLNRTRLPVPPGPVFVPINVQWYGAQSLSIRTSSICNSISGNALMNPCATSAISPRPAASAPLTLSEPFCAKNAATHAASRLHHAAVYLWARSLKNAGSRIIRVSLNPEAALLPLRASSTESRGRGG
jgi:hypothetical protein